jgi:hypothetical protein
MRDEQCKKNGVLSRRYQDIKIIDEKEGAG